MNSVLRHRRKLGVAALSFASGFAALSACSNDPVVIDVREPTPWWGGLDGGADWRDAGRFPDFDAGPFAFDGPFVKKASFGPTVTQAVPPPPVSGGTLLVTQSGAAVASDPDRDAVYVVDLSARQVKTIALVAGDEPGRLAEGPGGRVFVALRHSGQLLTIDVATAAIVARRDACGAPRGVAYEAATDSVHVACAGGELVTFAATGGSATRTVFVERDLRDVVVMKGALYVSIFRTATLLKLAGDGTVADRWTPPATGEGTATVAWRTLVSPDGEHIAMVHQRARTSAIVPAPGGYGGGGCSGALVATVVSVFDGVSAPAAAGTIPETVLPVDLAISAFPDRNLATPIIAIPGAGNSKLPFTPSVITARSPTASIVVDGGAHDAAPPPPPPPSDGGGPPCTFPSGITTLPGQATAVAFDATEHLLVQTREPAALHVTLGGARVATISLSTVSREDTGHAIFHSAPGAAVACASCHAEGGDDAHVWDFAGLGLRRTQSMRGTIKGTAPYHWDGAMRDFGMLAHEVLSGRMSGPELQTDQLDAVRGWVEALPPPPAYASVDFVASDRGRALFEGAAACSSCHSGAKHTNNATVDVGTGRPMQVPPLVGVGWRAPFLHTGCAKTLHDRFDPACGGDRHGNVATLAPTQIDDLVSYLESL